MDQIRSGMDGVLGSRRSRFILYGLLGWCAEVAFTGVTDFFRTRDRRLPARTSIWMFPIYGLLAPLYEPVHAVLRPRLSFPARAAVYGAGFLLVEYATGWALRRMVGEAPWDYSDAPYHVNGLIRPDYFVLWAIAGAALEPLHDRLAPSSA